MTPSRTSKAETRGTPAVSKVLAARPSTKKTEETVQRIRIKIRAYDHKIIDQSTKTIVETVERAGATVIGPVPLPTEKRRVTVNRSSFVHKDARDQFEMRVHKRLIDIVDPSSKVVDALTNLSLPAGVDVEMKMA